MTATNHDGHNNENVMKQRHTFKKLPHSWRTHAVSGHTVFRKQVCARHGCGRHGHCGRPGLWPSLSNPQLWDCKCRAEQNHNVRFQNQSYTVIHEHNAIMLINGLKYFFASSLINPFQSSLTKLANHTKCGRTLQHDYTLTQ